MPAVELVDPVGYSAVWTFVGIAMLAAVVAWFWWVFWSTRKRGEEERTAGPVVAKRSSSTMPGVSDPWAAVRRIYLDKLGELENRYLLDELDERGVHLEIRRVMRDFTKARTGIDAETFTALDAAKVSLTGPLAKSLKRLSHPSFARTSTAKVEHSLSAAQKVVREW